MSNFEFEALVSVACSVIGLAADGWRSSTVIDNSAAGNFDVLLTGSTQVAAVTAQGQLEVYAYGGFSDGNYTSGLDGTDVTITWGSTPSTSTVDGDQHLKLLGVVATDATDDNNDIVWGPFSVANGFGGVVPPKYGVVVHNDSKTALHATGTNNAITAVAVSAA